MSHSNIYAIRIVSDSKEGNWLNWRTPWRPITTEDLKDSGWEPEESDKIEDFTDEGWFQEIKWLRNTIKMEWPDLEAFPDIKKIEGSYFVQFKLGDLKKWLEKNKEAETDYEGGFYVIDQDYVDLDGLVEEEEDLILHRYPFYNWVENSYAFLHDEGTIKGKSRYGGKTSKYSLSDEDTFIIRIEGIIDYHY